MLLLILPTSSARGQKVVQYSILIFWVAAHFVGLFILEQQNAVLCRVSQQTCTYRGSPHNLQHLLFQEFRKIWKNNFFKLVLFYSPSLLSYAPTCTFFVLNTT